MARSLGLAIALILLSSAFAGCLGEDRSTSPEPAAAPAASTGLPACEHPFPCADGSEWPQGLEGPFEILDPEIVEVESFDGTPLHGVIWRPELPEGVKAPVVLNAGPYRCQSSACGDDPSWMERSQQFGALVEAGYAVALFNVRGTGLSGGCFDLSGPDERGDQVEVVRWLAQQPWSNGRVGMYGISYMGTTPWLAAVESPSALKTIVPLGVITDWYTESHSPQGAVDTGHGEAHFAGDGVFSWGYTPGARITGSEDQWASHAPEKACEDGVSAITEIQKGAYTGQRDAVFWDERRTLDELSKVTAAVFVTHGLWDNGGHAYQEDPVWNALTQAPKRMMLGQWGHEFPNDKLDGAPVEGDWADVLIGWMDFWLKGVGTPERLGTVDYQDTEGAWHNSTAWPPVKAPGEVLHLAGTALNSTPEAEDRSFRAHPAAGQARNTCSLPGTQTACETGLDTWLTYATEPLDEPLLVAGNPMAYLQLTSDQPGGMVTAQLLDAAPDAPCLRPGCDGIRHLTEGSADLRYHQGNYQPQDFPVGEPTPVRIDLYNLASRIEPGHRLVLYVSHGDVGDDHGPPGYAPVLTLHGGQGPEGSHLVLPLAEGTLDGGPPVLDYPARPFVARG